jgi:protein required for attachment to host cells
MKLENTIVIVADLGELKVYKVKMSEASVSNEIKKSYALENINGIAYIDAHKKISESVSDSAGNFAGSIGEDYNRENERKKRSLKEVANDINAIVENEKPKQLFLAFPQESLSKLLDILSQNTKTVLTKTVSSNLVKTDKNKILSHFK